VESTPQITDVAHVIQVAVAPVFLLSGIGAMLAAVVARLGRIVDRSRLLDDRLASADPAGKAELRGELVNLTRRSRLIDRAIVLATAAGFFVCLVIFTLFVEYLAKLRMSALVASLLASSPLRHDTRRSGPRES